MDPMVSIIVPVYNAKATIGRCIDSILNQTYSDFELLLVDDGSKDESGIICDEYAARDRRVTVFHKENGGVSAARNFALEQARGVYLQFLDSDDWITPDATQRLVSAAEDYQCDLVISDFYRVVGDRVSVKGDIDEDTVLTQEEFAGHMMENPSDFYYGVLWNKLYRRAIVEEHSIRMNASISWCEDFLFNLDYIRYAERFYALNVPLYYYVKTKGSLASQGANLYTTVQMKLTLFEYYNQLYKDILDEDEYQKRRLKVYSFLLDSANDGIVLPTTILPNVQKLGRERVQVAPDMLDEEGVIADAYRERKLLERCLESVAIQYDLSVNEAIVLLAMGHDGFMGSHKDLAEMTHLGNSTLARVLRQLSSRKFIQNTRRQVLILPPAEDALTALEKTIQDWKKLRFTGFDQEEILLYKSMTRRIRENVRQALK